MVLMRMKRSTTAIGMETASSNKAFGSERIADELSGALEV